MTERIKRLAGLLLAAAMSGCSDGGTPPSPRVVRPTLSIYPRNATIAIGRGSLRLQVSTSPPQPLSALRWRSTAPDRLLVSDSLDVSAVAACACAVKVWLAADSTVFDFASINTAQ